MDRSNPPPPPSPIPTAKGIRCAANPVFSQYLDKSIQIPELKPPPQPLHRSITIPQHIDYRSIRQDSITPLLRDFGAFQITNHGISTKDLKFALENHRDRIFGNQDKLVWRGDADDPQMAAIGRRNFHIFRQRMDNVARQLERIAQELCKIIAQSEGNKFQGTIQLGGPTLSLYRHYRGKVVHPTSSVTGTRIPESDSGGYALNLHLLLDPGEFYLGKLAFNTSPDTIVITVGKEIELWSQGELKSVQGKSMFRPFLHPNKPSFSVEQTWSATNFKNLAGKSNKVFSLADQILVLLIGAFLYKLATHYMLS